METDWKQGNRIVLLPDSRCFVPALLDAIDSARESIWLEQYLVESGRLTRRFFAALARAAQRGVEVHVLLDSFGAAGLGQRERVRLSTSGAALRHYNPFMMRRLRRNLVRTHRKLVLIDRRVAYTGGYCLTDDYLGDWFDLMVKMEGPVVADWITLFADLWESPRTHGDKAPIARQPAATGQPGNLAARLAHNEGQHSPSIRHSLHRQVVAATRRIWLYTPYFLPSHQLRRSLAEASACGIDVRLLVAGKGHDHPSVRTAGRRHYDRLLDAGVAIYEYQPRFTHAKFCIVDDWVTVGSCNFDHWSLHWNLEANVEVENAAFADELAGLFENHSQESRPILAETWKHRPGSQRLRERIAALIGAWLAGLR
ncbi:phosphatidylserine/phosphatidylglycerophosphate/cardiolipin synthase family protein [Halomonas sp. MCCC 1A17488]|uniref:Phosphatidylserine/phosphatidylglycerophosphate/ cardiolipin synthase family protein n=1 Tax=Billgrantia sulfidoxydans TaxID=2733484 RepID=A0ABX7W7R5_9GAMM|nr:MULTISPECIES: phosphatidylserine/phosphatidylglycerophosphate/cardiolipin synthase family protein [Halomonas]MCE8017894.1 phosphatidylserine/phosphatidylglycerophosphate/cardiolipin synthase family protein [Halomonas sp. MCCC 1A17488]MCG3241227.1 phosphatidylserine/phosphatidylglycerophosphate/cardiolipin synthase family protein [Halomonas sp. MCCC 1A17488]QPP49074.1 phosphatidylserine/phosphatidylglycerophosphate/cardiolipin synthase family protein [Halomonas sp. SS10-MC5]QTP56409.1 phospha